MTLYYCRSCNSRDHWADEACPKVANAVANAPVVVANGPKTKHGRYADRERRAGYMRDYMQVMRAIRSGRASRWPS